MHSPEDNHRTWSDSQRRTSTSYDDQPSVSRRFGRLEPPPVHHLRPPEFHPYTIYIQGVYRIHVRWSMEKERDRYILSHFFHL